MAEHFGFLNSGTTEELKRKYQDIDFAWMLSLFTGGQGYVSGYMDQLEVVDASTAEDMQVKVKSGAAWLGEPAGWWFINSDDKILKLDNTELSLGETRVDRVVVKLNRDTEELNINLEIRKGPFTDDFPEKLSTTDGRTHEISLANVVVTGESSAITITDERNSEYCGVVKFGGSSIGSSSSSLILENPSPIKAEDNVAGNLLSWIEETSMWEKREFGQPYDGSNIILPGGMYVEVGAFSGEEGFRLYRQADGTFSTVVRSSEYYIGYILDEDTVLVGVLGGVDKDYLENMLTLKAISGQSDYVWFKFEMPLDADGYMVRWKATAWTSGDDETTGTLIDNLTSDYVGANVWYKASGFTAGASYYIKAFPYASTSYNSTIGVNEITITPQVGTMSWDFDTDISTVVGDQFASYDLSMSGVTFAPAKIGNGAYFNGAAYLRYATIPILPSSFTFVCNFNTASFSTNKYLIDESDNYAGISRGYSIGFNTAGKLMLLTGNGSSGAMNLVTLSSMTGLLENTDYFIVVAFNRSTRVAKLWVDNVYIGSLTSGFTSISMTGVDSFWIGRYRYASLTSGVMTLDQYKIYTGELSDDNRGKLWNGGDLC